MAGYIVRDHDYAIGVNDRGVSSVCGIIVSGYMVGNDGHNLNVRGHSRKAIDGIIFSGVVLSYRL